MLNYQRVIKCNKYIPNRSPLNHRYPLVISSMACWKIHLINSDVPVPRLMTLEGINPYYPLIFPWYPTNIPLISKIYSLNIPTNIPPIYHWYFRTTRSILLGTCGRATLCHTTSRGFRCGGDLHPHATHWVLARRLGFNGDFHGNVDVLW